MPINRVQFQRRMPMPEFFHRYGSAAQCARAVRRIRWTAGFRSPHCGEAGHYRVIPNGRELFQCHACGCQTSLTAGTTMDNTKLLLRVRFLGMYRISQAKTGMSALSLKRDLGVSFRMADAPEDRARNGPC